MNWNKKKLEAMVLMTFTLKRSFDKTSGFKKKVCSSVQNTLNTPSNDFFSYKGEQPEDHLVLKDFCGRLK